MPNSLTASNTARVIFLRALTCHPVKHHYQHRPEAAMSYSSLLSLADAAALCVNKFQNGVTRSQQPQVVMRHEDKLQLIIIIIW